MPKVSVIMGAYNCQDTIERSINSIISQTYKDWELVICDDCSSDSTYEIMKKIARHDSRIIILRNIKNRKLGATLNKCLENTNGEYIARMDADDWCSEERLEKQVRFLDENPSYMVVGCGRVMFDDNGEYGILNGVEKPEPKDILRSIPFAHPTIMMRHSAYERLAGYRSDKYTKRAEDLDLWFRFYEFGFRGYNIQEPLYYYHESIEDLKKRTLSAALGTSEVYLRGIKKLGWSRLNYIYAIRPVISALLPNRLMMRYHNMKLRQLS